jgi:gliding motility-associated-like protein
MTKYFFLADFMLLLATRLSVPLRIIAFFVLLVPSDAFAQSCDCPAPTACVPCSGGFTRFTLRYKGLIQTFVTATDQAGTIYQGYVNKDETFTFSGSVTNEKFVGATVSVYIAGPILNGVFGTDCGSEYPGSTSGLFEIVSIISKSGGAVCCAPGTNDATPPTILGCPSNKTATLPAGACTVAVSWTEPTTSDNCSATWIERSHFPGSSFPAGITTVTYKAIDPYGNTSSTCSFTVTVNDVTAPQFKAGCPINIVKTADASCQAKVDWTPPIATDNNCNYPPDITATHNPGDIFPAGAPTSVTYTATDKNGNKATCTFTVTVEDNTPPEFQGFQPVITATADNTCVAKVPLPNITATDNCTDNPTVTPSHPDGTEFPIDSTAVTYTAVDASGNKATYTILVVVSNPEVPEIKECPGTITENTTAAEKDSAAVTWHEPWAEVNCGEARLQHQSHTPGSKFPVGTTPVTYTFTDDGGKISTCTFDVVVLASDVLFTISNVVTPDGDGINDVWTLPNIEEFKSNTVVVIDRWGNKIYQATGYDNVRTVWNGTNKNGTIVPTGTYFYTVEVRDQGKVLLKKGFIEVIQ